MEKSEKITRRDVAARAGVSVATVSYVLNNTPGVKIRENTRSKVLEAAQSLNYSPSYIGTALTTRRSFNVGMLLKSVHHLHYHFFREILIGAGTAMEEENHHMLFFFREREKQVIDSMRSGKADGILVIQADASFHTAFELAEQRVPMVLINLLPGNFPAENTAAVLPDHLKMMQDAIGSFVRKNCRRLSLISLPSEANGPLNDAFIACCLQYASAGVTGSYMNRGATISEFESKLLEMIRSGELPDGMFFNRLEYAEAACCLFEKHHIVPGKDIMVAACTPEEIPSRFPWQITLFAYDGISIGHTAWQLMKKLFSGTAEPRETVKVPFIKVEFPAETTGSGSN